MTDSAPTLRVGLLLNSLEVPAWVDVMLSRVVENSVAEVALIVLNQSATPESPRSLWARIFDIPGNLASRVLGRLLEWIEDKLVEPKRLVPDAFELVDIAAKFSSVPVIRVTPIQTVWSDRISSADVLKVTVHELDVIVRVGFRILRGDILSAARCGVWSFHHGDNRANRGGPPGYWEVALDQPETGSILQILTEDLDNGLVLARTWSATNRLSLRDSRSAVLWKSLIMLPRQLKRLRQFGAERFLQVARDDNVSPVLYSNRLYRRPSNRERIAITWTRLCRRLNRAADARVTHEQWVLLYCFSDQLASSLWRYKRIVPPRDRFYADPFPIERNGRHYVFFEEFIYAAGKGNISVVEVDENGMVGNPIPVLVAAEHLSYPFVFEYGGEVFMLPECRASRRITLYRCVQFPARWEKTIDLMTDVEAVDSSLFFRDGLWWLFLNQAEVSGASRSDELFVYTSRELLSSNWAPHANNPVVSDVRSARSAGRIFEYNGRIIRPSQDCGRRYGWALNFNEVVTLDPECYRETLISKATPTWAADVVAVHTFNSAGRLFMSDAQISRSNWMGNHG